jgi:hypothetical protein
MAIDSAEFDEMLNNMSSRPRMYCSSIKTGRDLIFFLKGACSGSVYPAHGPLGSTEYFDASFREYVYRHFNREPPQSGSWKDGEFMQILLEELGDKPFLEGHMAIGDLFRGIRHDTK